MTPKTAFIVSAALLAATVAPAALGRIDGNEGGTRAYPHFRYERSLMDEICTADILINRPIHQC
jgi:hypothetical protein